MLLIEQLHIAIQGIGKPHTFKIITSLIKGTTIKTSNRLIYLEIMHDAKTMNHHYLQLTKDQCQRNVV